MTSVDDIFRSIFCRRIMGLTDCQLTSIYRHYKAQRENIDAKWSLPEEYNVVYTDVAGELVVGGVFLRLFIANPGWVLRKPKEFLTELLEVWAQLVGSKTPDVSTCTQILSSDLKSRLTLIRGHFCFHDVVGKTLHCACATVGKKLLRRNLAYPAVNVNILRFKPVTSSKLFKTCNYLHFPLFPNIYILESPFIPQKHVLEHK